MKTPPHQISKLLLLCICLVANSCGSKENLDTSVPSPQTLEIEPGQIKLLYPHESRTKDSENLFTDLEVEKTGVSFYTQTCQLVEYG